MKDGKTLRNKEKFSISNRSFFHFVTYLIELNNIGGLNRGDSLKFNVNNSFNLGFSPAPQSQCHS